MTALIDATEYGSPRVCGAAFRQDISDDLRYLLDQQRSTRDHDPMVYARLRRRCDGALVLPVSRGFLQPHGHEVLTAYRPGFARCLVGVMPGFRYHEEPGFMPCRLSEIPEYRAMMKTTFNEGLQILSTDEDHDWI